MKVAALLIPECVALYDCFRPFDKGSHRFDREAETASQLDHSSASKLRWIICFCLCECVVGCGHIGKSQ